MALPLRTKRVNEFLIYRHVTNADMGRASTTNSCQATYAIRGTKTTGCHRPRSDFKAATAFSRRASLNMDDKIALRLIYLLEEMNRQGKQS